MQYYQNHPLPQEVIVPLELDIEALQEVITCKLIQPVKGYRKKLLDMRPTTPRPTCFRNLK